MPHAPFLLFTAGHAGSANFLAPVLRQLSFPWRAFAHSEAASIFERQDLSCTLVQTCDWDELPNLGREILAGGDYSAIVTGTSPMVTLDKAATLAARAVGLPSVAIIEHWSHYRERFARIENGRIVAENMFLPDQIWVNDEVASAEATKAGLPAERIRIAGQPHLEMQSKNLGLCKVAQRSRTVVFVSEQLAKDFVRDTPLSPGFDEFEALAGLVAAMPVDAELVIKLHPEESPDKYADLASRDVRVSVVSQCDIAALIASAGHIVGMMSMLLMEAALVRDDVISFMPGGSPTDFIGNRIGATRAVTSQTELAAILRAAAPVTSPDSDFARRFAGSTDRVVSLLTELAACA